MRRSLATPKPIRRSTSTASTRRTSWRSWRRWRSAGRSRSTRCMSRASGVSRRSTSRSPPSLATASSCSASRAMLRPASRRGCILAWCRQSAPIARVDGVFNAVVAEGDFVGRVMLEGRGAGAGPTASAVVADLIDIARNRHTPVWGAASADLSNAPSVPMSAHVGAYYLRLMVVDRPGVIADVTAVLRDQGVSLESMLQRGRVARRGGAGGAGDARDAGERDARGADADRRAERGAGGADDDPDRSGVAAATVRSHRHAGPWPPPRRGWSPRAWRTVPRGGTSPCAPKCRVRVPPPCCSCPVQPE